MSTDKTEQALREALKAVLDMVARGVPDAGVVYAARSLLTAAPPAQPQSEPSATSILGAVARGWCHDKNKNKTMDPDLAIAIAAEVSALLAATPPAQPQNECKHNWVIWPETDGLEQQCSLCKTYRATPEEEKFWKQQPAATPPALQEPQLKKQP